MLSQARGTWLIVHAPAKVNLFLEVHARRPDGFHDLTTLMANIDLVDTLKVRTSDSPQITLRTTWQHGLKSDDQRVTTGDLPPENKNLVYLAVEKMQQRAAIDQGLEIELIKRIPSGAGLGGASSDAAWALWAANQVWQLGWSPEQLRQLASELGSDIPFFIPDQNQHRAGAAICRGRGEQIARCEVPAGLHVVVARPPVSLSTAEVYGHCQPAAQAKQVEPLVQALQQGCPAKIHNRITNRLMPAAQKLTPWIERLAGEFSRQSCYAHQMTGSGSCYFGLFPSATAARIATARLRARRLGRVWYVRTC